MNISANKDNQLNILPTKRSFLQNFYDAWKICKYEFLMSRILVVLTCIILFSILSILFLQKTLQDSHSNGLDTTLTILSIILGSALFIFTISYFLSAAISFYHGIFGRNAYLTHSLPISLDSILFSKIFIFVLWSAIFGCELLAINYLMKNSSIGQILYAYYYASFPSILQALIIPAFRWLQITASEITYIFMIVALVHRKKTFTMFYGITLYFIIKVILGIFLILVVINGGKYMTEFIRYYDNLKVTDINFWIFNLLLFLPSCIFYVICRFIVQYKLSL